MIGFYIAAAVMTVLAIAIIVPPLLRKSEFEAEPDDLRLSENLSAAEDRLKRLKAELDSEAIDQTTYERAREDIEKNLALDIDRIDQQNLPNTTPSPVMAVAVALLVPLFAGFLYLSLGTPDAIENTGATTSESTVNEQPTAADVDEMVAGLAKRLEDEPDNVEGWYRLGQSYLVLGRFDESIAAARRVRELSNDDPAALLLHASALSGASDGSIEGETEELVLAVIKVQPENPQALWMAGMGARQREDRVAAIEYWNRLLPLLAPQPEQQQELRTLIAATEAEITAGTTGTDTGTPPDSEARAADTSGSEATTDSDTTRTTDSAAAGSREADASTDTAAGSVLNVHVSLDPSLVDQAKADHSVFVFARAMDGPPMPLAVVRTTVADLPVTVQLDDSSAMLPAMTLSKFDQVFVGARISPSGDAIGQSGDLEGSVSPVDTKDADEVRVTIDSVRQ